MLSQWLRFAAMQVVFLIFATTAQAQTWPSGPIRLIIPFPAAGQTDLIGRAYAESLRAVVNQTVIPENKTGAGGNLGASIAAQSPGDGQTLVVVTPGPISINRWLYKSQGFDPDKDLKMVSVLGLITSGIAVNPKIPANNLTELVKYIESRADFKTGTPGVGTTGHLMIDMFKADSKLKTIQVPYRGGAPGLQALMGGEVEMFIDGIPAMVEHHKRGAMKIIAVTSPKRFGLLPDIPTVTEQGFPQLTNQAWFGIAVPGSTPDDLVQKIHAATLKAAQDPVFLQRMATLGIDPHTTTPAEMTKLAQEEAQRWKSVIQQSGSKLE